MCRLAAADNLWSLAFTALPLLLSVLDLKIPPPTDLPAKRAAKKHRFHVLVEAMKVYEPLYDGVEYISTAIKHFVESAELEPCLAHRIV